MAMVMVMGGVGRIARRRRRLDYMIRIRIRVCGCVIYGSYALDGLDVSVPVQRRRMGWLRHIQYALVLGSSIRIISNAVQLHHLSI